MNPDDGTRAPRPLTPPPLPLWAAVLVAAGAGPILDGAFPDRGWWPLAFVAIPLALWAQRGRSVGGGLLVGLVFGAAFYFLHIEWATTFLGPVPWSALSGLMAIWCGLGGVLLTLAWRWVPRVWPGALGRLLLLPTVLAGLWTLREGVSAVWPYGGFSWGRVAFSQSDSPISGLFSWLGASGVSFVMVLLGGVALTVVIELGRLHRATRPGDPTRRLDRALAWRMAAVPVLLGIVAVAVPGWPSVTEGTVRVGAVQGNAKAGYFDPPAYLGANLDDQVAASAPILGDDLDVVIWPEGGSDLDPLRDPAAARLWDAVAREADAPLVAGTITNRRADDGTERFFNTSLLWRAGEGALDFYDKKHPVPFGEYVPDRAFWRQFAPDLIDLIQREYTPGTTDPVMDLGDAVAGIAICFDIVDDALLRDMVAEGANVVFAQSNNADFGLTDESVQQLAITRIRALELGRSVVNISTVGTSAIALPDGRLIDELPRYTAAAMVTDVPLSTSVTPAAVAGGALERGLTLGALGALVLAGLRNRPRRGGRGGAGPRVPRAPTT
jgi:apolipoprotein N-acyltransferase